MFTEKHQLQKNRVTANPTKNVSHLLTCHIATGQPVGGKTPISADEHCDIKALTTATPSDSY